MLVSHGKRAILALGAALLLVSALPLSAGAAGLPAGRTLADSTRFYVPKADRGAISQIVALTRAHERQDAYLVKSMVNTPQAVWFTGGTPNEVRRAVSKIVSQANARKTVPVLVAYNIPYRDCAQYSAGGAVDTAAYKAWIDGFAAGIGKGKAVVILEPDGLGIIPWYNQFLGLPSQGGLEWCQPMVDGAPAPEADPAHRFEQLNYAVDALEAHASVAVYLDGTHSNWLGAGDSAHRLVQAGVTKAQGFFLNVSNFEPSERLQKYGSWISKCIWFGTQGSWGIGHFDWCASQYYPANPADFSTWGLTDQWYTDNVESQSWVPYPGDAGLAHFVVDTSRNGQGAWQIAPGTWPDNQTWCNPIDRGLGLRPTANTGVELIDAYLWIKIPGASDGGCTRGTPGPEDPARGMVDPAAGVWFPQMALELVHNANPAIVVPPYIR